MTFIKGNSKPLDEAYLLLRAKLSSIKKTFNVSDSDAEDLIQEGYLRLVDKNIETSDEAKGKLWTTVRHLSIDIFRKEKKMTAIEALQNNSYIDSNNLDYDFIKSQLDKILSPLQREIMRLLIEDELDYPEIAERLQMKEGAIRTNVSRARKLLKERIEL